MSPRKKPFRRPEYKQKKKKKNEYRNRYKSDDNTPKKVPLTVLTSVAAAVLLIITGIGIWAGVPKGNNVVPTAVNSVVSVTETAENSIESNESTENLNVTSSVENGDVHTDDTVGDTGEIDEPDDNAEAAENGEVNTGGESEHGENTPEQIKELSPLDVHFIDVGQGDSVLLTCGGESMLIDGGDEYKGTTVQLYLSKHNISKLKYVIASHPDSDHIGGLDVIVTKYDIESEAVFIPDIYRETKAYEDLAEAVKYRNYRMIQPECGQEYLLGDSVVTIVYESSELLDDNDRSLVVKVTHGDAGFLFTGDISSVSEETLAEKYDLSADVLKVSHHGSAYSTTSAFVKTVGPSHAIFSVGENVYGHPDYEVAKRLNSYGSKLYRTDSQGSIVVVSDGKDITVNTVPCDISAFEPVVEETPIETTYILNINTNKFHYPGCDSVDRMKEKNKKPVTWTREECIAKGYVPCGNCHP